MNAGRTRWRVRAFGVSLALIWLFPHGASGSVQTQQANTIRSIEFLPDSSAQARLAVQPLLGMPLTTSVRRTARQRLLASLASSAGEWSVTTAASLDAAGTWTITLTPPAPTRLPAPADALRRTERHVMPAPAPPPRGMQPQYTAGFTRWTQSTSRVLVVRADRVLWLKTSAGIQRYPIAVGRRGHTTPVGQRTVLSVTQNPTWYPTLATRRDAQRRGTALPRQVPPGPANPLGSHFIALGQSIGIHGTNAPASIGSAVSRGCIRMLPQDIRSVASTLRAGDGVWIVDSLTQQLEL